MSLGYADEHLAWKQRVAKETFASSYFNRTYSPIRRETTSPIKSSKQTVGPREGRREMSPAAMSRTFVTPVRYVTAEVRGKYARPQLFNNLYVSNLEKSFASPTSSPIKKSRRTASRASSRETTSRYITTLESQVRREREKRMAAESKLAIRV